ncbi:uncharacterized protein [Temnothorax nylanderi]|uniref:uncharacterized protein n=1 Tax=Temnothorax nylanderi TaxID=102681 RepID=UPI003A8AD3C5
MDRSPPPSPPSKKKKLCKDVEGSSDEASQSTTSPKKSQEKLSPRHSGSSSQEQTPQPGTSRSPISPAQTPPKNLQEQTPQPGTSRSPTSPAQTPPKNPQEIEQTPSAGTSEETEKLRTCIRCGKSFTSESMIYMHYLLSSCTRKKELTPSAGTSQAPIFPPEVVITALINRLNSYYADIKLTLSAETSRTSEEPEVLHMCPKCGESFKSNLFLVYHLLKIHKFGSPSQEQTPSAGTSQSPISPEEDLSMITELIALLNTDRQEQTPSAGTSRTSEETEESHPCSKCTHKCISILWLAYHLLVTHADK